MDCFIRKHDSIILKKRYTPMQELESPENSMNFTFSEWKKLNMKRSPTSVDVKRIPLIKNFYHNEQKKIIKIHRSFDNKKRNDKYKVEEMNSYIKSIITSSYIPVEKKTNPFKKLISRENSEDSSLMNSTPYFTSNLPKTRFPRDVFSSKKSKHRNY